MSGREDGDSIEEIYLDRNVVSGTKAGAYSRDCRLYHTAIHWKSYSLTIDCKRQRTKLLSLLYFLLNLRLAQSDCRGRFSAVFVFDGSIVLFGCVYILMAKDICNEINVSGFLIKGCAEGGAELMAGDFLLCYYGLRIFAD